MIHTIEADKMIIYTNEEGAKQFKHAFREILLEEIDRLKEIERRKELYKVINENKQKQRDLMRTFIKSIK